MALNENGDQCTWGTRRLYLMAMLCQTIGTATFVSLPNVAITNGTTGYIIGYMLAFVLVGIPLLYMELIVSQFTARGCVAVWRTRACLSHIGYVQIFWQLFLVVYNHAITVFVLHYFLISFEDPIPYFVCGFWSTKHCNTERFNFTVYQDCTQLNRSPPYCENLHTTYPEYQYWRYFILGWRQRYYYVSWRVCLASGITCAVIYLSCFKRKKSGKWFIYFFTIYPTVGYVLLFIGSMVQKGIVVMVEEALDSKLRIFKEKYKISSIIQQVVYSLNIGTGISFNMGSSTSFRAPCYSNAVITVVACCLFSVVTVCTVAMMACPYAYENACRSTTFINTNLSLLFEKTPRLLKEYDHTTFWLILNFSCNATLALSTNVIIILSCLESLAKRFSIVDKYCGLVAIGVTIVIFFITTPLLGNVGIYIIFDFKWFSQLITIFIGMLEGLVFVIWYGLNKFSEDVHFMQGIQPKFFMKLSWISSILILAYVFCNELYINPSPPGVSMGTYMGWWALIVLISVITVIAIVKIVIGTFKKKFWDTIKLSPTWGPRTEVLQRSRAMFSAQAMTKEYMYRQYNLQAGILDRQNASNVRRHL